MKKGRTPIFRHQRWTHHDLDYRLLIWCVLFLFLTSCSRERPAFPQAPIFLITIDTLRSDRLPAYGYSKIETPSLDQFARDSVLFEHAYAHTPLTLPSHATILTGLLPFDHQIHDNMGFFLDESNTTLAEVLMQAGYHTGAAVSSVVLRETTGTGQGFEFYDDEFQTGNLSKLSTYAERIGQATLEIARTWLDSATSKPVFLFVHLYDPHAPYQAPEPFHSETDDPYDGEIRYIDHQLGRFFDFLKETGRYDPAIIVVASDHGEGLGDHGEEQHGMFVYREAVQVPLMIKLPGNESAGTRVTPPVGLCDVTPTLLHLVGGELETDGRPLFPLESLGANREIFCESLNPMLSFGWHPVQSIIGKGLQYITSDQPQLFDLVSDPMETKNIIDDVSVPESFTTHLKDFPVDVEPTSQLSPEDAALLGSLGYLGSTTPRGAMLDLSEAELMRIFNAVGNCKLAIDQGKYAESEAVLERILSRFPDLMDARLFYSLALECQGKLTQAEEVLIECLAMAPNDLSFLAALLGVKLALKKDMDAQALIQKTLEVGPSLGAKMILPILERNQAYDQMEPIVQNLIKRHPNFPHAYYFLGRIAINKGKFSLGQSHFQKALDLAGDNLEAELEGLVAYGMADGFARQNQATAAIAHFQKAISLNPNLTEARTGLSLLYFSLNQPQQAILNLEDWIIQFPQSANIQKAAELCNTVGLPKVAEQFLAIEESKNTPKPAQ